MFTSRWLDVSNHNTIKYSIKDKMVGVFEKDPNESSQLCIL